MHNTITHADTVSLINPLVIFCEPADVLDATGVAWSFSMPRALIFVTHNIHLLRLVAFCKHFFIKAVQRYSELDQEAKKEVLLRWSHAKIAWSKAPFISLSDGAASLRCSDAIRFTGELFIYLFSFMNDAMTDDDETYPPKLKLWVPHNSACQISEQIDMRKWTCSMLASCPIKGTDCSQRVRTQAFMKPPSFIFVSFISLFYPPCALLTRMWLWSVWLRSDTCFTHTNFFMWPFTWAT